MSDINEDWNMKKRFNLDSFEIVEVEEWII